jgi:hypothetical protein
MSFPVHFFLKYITVFKINKKFFFYSTISQLENWWNDTDYVLRRFWFAHCAYFTLFVRQPKTLTFTKWKSSEHARFVITCGHFITYLNFVLISFALPCNIPLTSGAQITLSSYLNLKCYGASSKGSTEGLGDFPLHVYRSTTPSGITAVVLLRCVR